MHQEKVLFIRHSKAGYKTYQQILNSDNPEEFTKPKNQVIPDLPDKGISLAKSEAEKLFSGMDPEKDAIFFISGDQARALETAIIYKTIAKERGFTVIRPEHHRNPLAERMDEEEIRVVRPLSLQNDNPFWSAIYYPPSKSPSINWKKIDVETKSKWEKAHEIVVSDDKGSWGANFLYHSDALREFGLLPGHQNTAKGFFDKQFQQIIRLVRFAAQKAGEGFENKKVRFIFFSHENHLLKALEQYFNERIDNCEIIAFDVNPDGSIIMTKKGKSIPLKYNHIDTYQ